MFSKPRNILIIWIVMIFIGLFGCSLNKQYISSDTGKKLSTNLSKVLLTGFLVKSTYDIMKFERNNLDPKKQGSLGRNASSLLTEEQCVKLDILLKRFNNILTTYQKISLSWYDLETSMTPVYMDDKSAVNLVITILESRAEIVAEFKNTVSGKTVIPDIPDLTDINKNINQMR